MIARLPRWVEAGGFGLAANAGAVNAIALLGFKQQTVSNLTGTSTRIGVALAGAELPEVAYLLLILLAFMFGATVSGMIIGNTMLRLGRHYSFVLTIEAGLLLVAMAQLIHGHSIGYLLAAAACGLQNGMVSTYSGAIVRTSHVTGLITDLGLAFGARLRGHPIGSRRLVLYLLLLSGFIMGGAIGAYAFQYLHFTALLLPITVAVLYSVMYWIYRHMSVAGRESY